MGAHTALRRLFADLPDDFPAPILVVVHLAANAPGTTASLLDRAGPLPVETAFDGEPLRPGRGYVAPPDRHLMVERGSMRVVMGPRENRWRPAIDVLFRSAALAAGRGTIGVLLSGFLDDGVAGLDAIRRRGGATVVQDPEDAEYPDLSCAALEALEIDHVVNLEGMPELLGRLLAEPLPEGAEADPAQDLTVDARANMESLERLMAAVLDRRQRATQVSARELRTGHLEPSAGRLEPSAGRLEPSARKLEPAE